MPKITDCWLFVGDDDKGEGVVGFRSTEGWMPLVCADLLRVDSLRKIAQDIANQTNREIRVLRFSEMEVVETISPTTADA